MPLVSDLTADVTDDAVHFIYRVENRGDAPVHLQFRSGQRCDVVVEPIGGSDPVWRASDGRYYTMEIGTLTLAPGEMVSYDERMEDVEPGEYEAEATLSADTEDVPASTTFHVD